MNSRITKIVEANRQILVDMKNGKWTDDQLSNVYPSKYSSQCAMDIIKTLQQRSGFSDWWDGIDDPTQLEIILELDDIILKEYEHGLDYTGY